MLISIIPKLPMRDNALTQEYYVSQLGFELVADYEDYLMAASEELPDRWWRFYQKYSL